MVCVAQILDRKNNELEDLRSEHRVKVHQLESQCKKLERKGEEGRRDGGGGGRGEGEQMREREEESGEGGDQRDSEVKVDGEKPCDTHTHTHVHSVPAGVGVWAASRTERPSCH